MGSLFQGGPSDHVSLSAPSRHKPSLSVESVIVPHAVKFISESALAPIFTQSGQAVTAVPAANRKGKVKPQRNAEECTFALEYINDTGARPTIFSNRTIETQGVPKAILEQLCFRASQRISFGTGGGTKITTFR